jgi:hypothetical protein
MNKRLSVKSEAQGEMEAVQLALKGMWTEAVKGCPHKVGGQPVARCGENEMRPCIYELAPELRHGGCETFKAIIHEWQVYYRIEVYQWDYYKELGFDSNPDLALYPTE